jgi:lipopolysaccharide export system protein LptC
VKLSATRLFPLVLLLTLALLSFWLERTSREQPASTAQRLHDPDYSVEHFTVTDYNLAGTPVATLAAARMVHYPEDDSTDLVAPRLTQALPEQPRLRLSADRGMLSRDAADVYLYDNVVLLREPENDTRDTRMQTSFLHVIQARALIRTDREVRITERGRSLIGRGMEYDNATRQLSLDAQVRGSFEAQQ